MPRGLIFAARLVALAAFWCKPHASARSYCQWVRLIPLQRHAYGFLSFTAGERQLVPLRVFAPHRGLISMGAVLRLMRKLFFARRVGVVAAHGSFRFLLARRIRLNRTYNRLSARFDVHVPNVDTAWAIAADALERINELRNHSRALEGVPEVNVTML
jgi:hypothetical protein